MSRSGTGDVSVRPLRTGDPADVEAAYQIAAAVAAHDVPGFPVPREDFVAGFGLDWPGDRMLRWLAFVGAEPAGFAAVTLPTLENTGTAQLNLVVRPDRRRRGIGRALHATAVEAARAAGRTTLKGQHVAALPGGAPRAQGHAAFAVAMGAKPALLDVRRELDLAGADRAAWAALAASAGPHATGYSLVRWTDRTPDEHIAAVAALDSRLLLDMPLGDLDMEPQKVDPARVRAHEEVLRRRGRRVFSSAARHDASGLVVAWTAIGLDAGDNTHAWQHVTIVDPDHRGHRLGLLVKLDNLAHLLAAEPGRRTVNTFNAAENEHMIAINEAIGFRLVDAWLTCQQEI